ncbi:hypothetical protein, partial [Agromyces terreus]|uniref:hypothetical protein n=1 Tax=Agromyces terreus TaxID=424795 RepID=UPI0031E3B887
MVEVEPGSRHRDREAHLHGRGKFAAIDRAAHLESSVGPADAAFAVDQERELVVAARDATVRAELAQREGEVPGGVGRDRERLTDDGDATRAATRRLGVLVCEFRIVVEVQGCRDEVPCDPVRVLLAERLQFGAGPLVEVASLDRVGDEGVVVTRSYGEVGGTGRVTATLVALLVRTLAVPITVRTLVVPITVRTRRTITLLVGTLVVPITVRTRLTVTLLVRPLVVPITVRTRRTITLLIRTRLTVTLLVRPLVVPITVRTRRTITLLIRTRLTITLLVRTRLTVTLLVRPLVVPITVRTRRTITLLIRPRLTVTLLVRPLVVPITVRTRRTITLLIRTRLTVTLLVGTFVVPVTVRTRRTITLLIRTLAIPVITPTGSIAIVRATSAALRSPVAPGCATALLSPVRVVVRVAHDVPVVCEVWFRTTVSVVVVVGVLNAGRPPV